MTVGLNPASLSSSPRLASWVTKTASGEFEFTEEGLTKANKIVSSQLLELLSDPQKRNEFADQQIKPISNQLTHLIKATPDDKDARERLEAICKKLDSKPIAATTTQGLANEVKARQKANLLEKTESLKAALVDNVLNACKKQYEQKEFDNEVLKKTSYPVLPILYAFGTAFQLTKTLFKAIFLSVPIEIIDFATHSNYGPIAGFSAVKKDLANTVGLAIKVFGCLNPKKEVSSEKSCDSIYNVLTWEKDVPIGVHGALPTPAGYQEPSLVDMISQRWMNTFYS